jgi:hypothetical protein
MTLHSTLALWLSLALTNANAQVGPDGLAEAARLAAHAQTLEDECRYRESSEWLSKAIDRLKEFRSTDVSQTRAAGSLLAQLEIRRREVKQQPEFFARQEQQVTRLLAAARVETADRALRATVAPACDSRFAHLADEIARRQAAARNLVREGEASVRRYDKKAATSTFQRAASLDAEVPGLAEGFQKARNLRGSHKAVKVFVAILVTGTLGGGGYYAYQKYGNKPTAQTNSSRLVVLPPR